MNTAHEISHATTGEETRVYWNPSNSSPIPNLKGIMSTVGTESVNGKRDKIGGAIENGLAIMDTLDIYNQSLKDMFPKEHARKVKSRNALATRIGWSKTLPSLLMRKKFLLLVIINFPYLLLALAFPLPIQASQDLGINLLRSSVER